jgi:hypothetical protein
VVFDEPRDVVRGPVSRITTRGDVTDGK